jgi:serine/threonine-protein kinase HipA
MAGRPSASRALAVWMNAERVGTWRLSRNVHEFLYDEAWLGSLHARPLSLSLPLAGGPRPLRGERVRAWFDNLLPESPAIRARLALRYRAESTEPFDLLEQIGRDCAGAVQLLPEAAPAPDVRRIDAKLLKEDAVERLIAGATTANALDQSPEEDLRISVAGAQEKTALLRHRGRWHLPLGATPTTHLIKLPLGVVGARQVDLSTSVENEWLCLELLRAFGMPVANARIETIGRFKVLVVERFDRRLIGKSWIARLPQEDFCQATGTPPERKYEADGGPGVDTILDILRGSEQAQADRELFLRAQLLFWMLVAPDGHAKNFSIFIEAQGRYRMTPLYDVVSAWPVIGRKANQVAYNKLTLAMALRGANAHYRVGEIRRHHFNQTAKRCAMGENFEPSIERVLNEVENAIDAVAAALPKGFPGEVAGTIFTGVRYGARRLEQMSRH